MIQTLAPFTKSAMLIPTNSRVSNTSPSYDKPPSSTYLITGLGTDRNGLLATGAEPVVRRGKYKVTENLN